MAIHKTATRLLMATTLAAAIAVGSSATAVATQPVQPRVASNPDQAAGPGVITVEQVNMCMWGSVETDFCFDNPHEEDEAGWEAAERETAEQKTASLITQYERQVPDVLTVSEGCLEDLRTVAAAIGYQLRYQETGGGKDGKPRECTVDRGAGVNAILAPQFSGDGPQGYFQDHGYRSYLCSQVSVAERNATRVCTSHLSLSYQDNHQEVECEKLRDSILGESSGDVIFAGDVNMKGAGQHCAPSDFEGLKNTGRTADSSIAGLQHIYYSEGLKPQSCGWSYDVADTDHRGFLLELGDTAPGQQGECWRDISQ